MYDVEIKFDMIWYDIWYDMIYDMMLISYHRYTFFLYEMPHVVISPQYHMPNVYHKSLNES